MVTKTYEKKSERVPFSMTQLKNVFRDKARSPSGSENVDDMYIVIKDFKDMFYPGRETDKDYHKSKKDIEREQKLRGKPADDSDDFNDDDAS